MGSSGDVPGSEIKREALLLVADSSQAYLAVRMPSRHIASARWPGVALGIELRFKLEFEFEFEFELLLGIRQKQ